MLDQAAEICRRLDAGQRVVAATVVRVEGSAPRAVGSSFLVGSDGTVAGSVSGGCVESDLVERCRGLLDEGPAHVVTYGVGDDLGAPGITCGGTIAVLVHEVTALPEGALHQVRRAAEGLDACLLLDEQGRVCTETPLVTLRTPAAHPLLVVGAGEHAVALTRLAATCGFAVTVLDQRPLFATKERFPDAYAVVRDWPDRWLAAHPLTAAHAVAVLTHDQRVDVPTLTAALASPARYVGAMGSRATHARRVEALRAAGVGPDALARLRSPIGLDLGGSTPQEVALSILAEVVMARHGTTGRPLSTTTTPLHPR
ncbi:XdhC family protein [Cellulomonas sp. Sa3CUA2]|uniref:XdhC family protein n=1 Tax=Cellulomonas avistercoris TaxID=2762242 RepID=A0ABR8QH34_9CELL|nr:XdhC/CoxI family protein [Cellulomonas avistercoris]MBD7919738.1 XdhC family protein [Cellulomonas avistercoris]